MKHSLILIAAIVLFSCKPVMGQNPPNGLRSAHIQRFVGLQIHGDIDKDSVIKSRIVFPPNFMADSVFEVIIGNGYDRYAVRDTAGVWKIYNPEKALELMYRNFELFQSKKPVKPFKP